MSESQVNELEGMDIDQLKQQADALEIDYRSNIGRPALLTKIKHKMGFDQGNTEEVASSGDTDMVSVIVGMDENDKQPAYAGLNGKSYRAVRGQKVTVPRAVVEIWQRATRPSAVTDKEGTRVVQVPKYSIQFF